MNKCDLIKPCLVLAWQKYFEEKYPGLTVVPFCSIEGCKTARGLLKMAKQSSMNLISACEKIVKNQSEF